MRPLTSVSQVKVVSFSLANLSFITGVSAEDSEGRGKLFFLSYKIFPVGSVLLPQFNQSYLWQELLPQVLINLLAFTPVETSSPTISHSAF